MDLLPGKTYLASNQTHAIGLDLFFERYYPKIIAGRKQLPMTRPPRDHYWTTGIT